MKSGKMTNILLALVLFALIGNFVAPLLRAEEATAGAQEAAQPAAAVEPERPPVEKAARRIEDGLREIAKSNHQIALAIVTLAQSNERVALSLDKVAVELRGRQTVP